MASKTLKLEDEILRSRKIHLVASWEPLAAALYPWFLFLGGDDGHGCFELDYDVIKGRILPKFPLTVDDVRRILDLYERAGLVILYRDTRGRDLGAFTNFRGWSDKRAARPKFPPPPGVEDRGALWNVPTEDVTVRQPSLLTEVVPATILREDLVMVAHGEPPRERPVVEAPPDPPRAAEKGNPPDTPEIREVIDYWLKATKAPSRIPYSKHNRGAVARTLGKGDYTVTDCKVAIFLTMYGPDPWVREHNVDLEYMIRPAVIERTRTKQAGINLAAPAIQRAANEAGLYSALIALGIKPGGDSGRPEESGFQNTADFKRLSEQLRGAGVKLPVRAMGERLPIGPLVSEHDDGRPILERSE